MTEEIFGFLEAAREQSFAIWFLIGAALVFFMQAGFAMVETGFTRAKNAGNIIMKNLMDFCIGTVMFIIIGFSLLLGEDLVGIIGKPGFDLFTAYPQFADNGMLSQFVFNLVFCATTSTIVSGAMAERTKFLSYCVYSAVISGLIYPIEAHWIWGGGWLSQLGFHDFAGSCAIHMVGGVCALIGAKMVGDRIGKFSKNKAGKVTKVNAIPGHNIPIGALGCFILWFGWYGFNGAACTSVESLGSVFLTTTIAPAIATVVCLLFTWIRYKKPDVSMCLNASLAGLVAITAPCDVVDATGAIVIGAVAGLLVCFGVWFLDNVLHIDDPVGAVAVHFMNGMWGTIAVGLFATGTTPDYAIADAEGNAMIGLFYGGGAKLLGIQALGLITVVSFAAITITIAFFIIKAIFGLRVSTDEEIQGLDSTEHGLPSAYAGFNMASVGSDYIEVDDDEVDAFKAQVTGSESVADAVPVMVAPSTVPEGRPKMTKVEILCKERKLEKLKNALSKVGITGMTVTHVMGCGAQKGQPEYYRGAVLEPSLLPKIKIDVVVCSVPVKTVVDTAKKVLYTGHIGDGKIFVYDVEKVVRVRTGEEDVEALLDAQ